MTAEPSRRVHWGGVRTYVQLSTGTIYGSPVSQSCVHLGDEKRASDSLSLVSHLPVLFSMRKKLTQEIVSCFCFFGNFPSTKFNIQHVSFKIQSRRRHPPQRQRVCCVHGGGSGADNASQVWHAAGQLRRQEGRRPCIRGNCDSFGGHAQGTAQANPNNPPRSTGGIPKTLEERRLTSRTNNASFEATMAATFGSKAAANAAFLDWAATQSMAPHFEQARKTGHAAGQLRRQEGGRPCSQGEP